MEKEITIWYDKKADFLEVMFEKKHGYFRDTENDAVMEKVDMKGNVIGFSIMGVSSQNKPLSVTLVSHFEEKDPDEPTGSIRRKHIKEHMRRKPRDPKKLEIFCKMAEAAVAEGVIFDGNRIVEILPW
jgi:uncharacterized protein YuzE